MIIQREMSYPALRFSTGEVTLTYDSSTANTARSFGFQRVSWLEGQIFVGNN